MKLWLLASLGTMSISATAFQHDAKRHRQLKQGKNPARQEGGSGGEGQGGGNSSPNGKKFQDGLDKDGAEDAPEEGKQGQNQASKGGGSGGGGQGVGNSSPKGKKFQDGFNSNGADDAPEEVKAKMNQGKNKNKNVSKKESVCIYCVWILKIGTYIHSLNLTSCILTTIFILNSNV